MTDYNATIRALQERRRREVQEDVARGFTTEEAMARASHITAQIAEARTLRDLEAGKVVEFTTGPIPTPPAPPAVSPEEEADIRARHRHYAIGQLRQKAQQMSRDFDRDVAAGKLEGAALIRAHARVMSYTDLLTTLAKLKGLI